MDIDAFFLLGPDAEHTAQDVFTNRVSELASFDASVGAHDVTSAVASVEDVRRPRHNVLVYYGLGGIGKSRLSHELQARFVAQQSPGARIAHRIDFQEAATADLEGLLLGLRASLGQFRPSWPAFDLALATYWERMHPGVALSEALNESSRLRQVSSRLRLGDQVQDAVEDLLEAPGGVLGVFFSGARALGGSVAERLRERRLLEQCPLFAPVIEETDPRRMRPYLAALLAWDLAQLQDEAEEPPRLAVFLDSWEQVQEEEPRPGGPEDLLSRVVHLMPNALFVITGRDRLRWGDEDVRGLLQYGGSTQWPGLVPGAESEPRQHLVGGLSSADAERHLRACLLAGDRPALPPDVRAAIVRGSEGLPLYLDLAVYRFRQLVGDGQVPIAGDFGQPLPQVVLRVMRDLAPDQRHLLRLASLVGAFDGELLRAGMPDLDDASIRRFLDRTLVQQGTGWAEYSLHECLREAVRPSDVSADRWSDREWDLATGRLLDALQARAAPELRAAGSLGQDVASGIFLDAWRLSLGLGSAPAWVLQLAARLQARGALDPLTWVGPATPVEHGLRPTADGLAAVGARAHLGHARVADVLEAALAGGALSPAAHDFLSIWLAWQYDSLGRRADADEIRLRLAREDGPFTAAARHAIGRNDWVQGRLARALSWPFDEQDPAQRAAALGISSRVAWVLGRFAEAERLCRARVAAAEEMRSPEALAHALRTQGESRCWSDPGGDDKDSREAVRIYDRLGNVISAGEAVVSTVVHRIGLDPVEPLLARLDVGRRMMRGGGYADCAEVFLWCVADEPVRAMAARDRFLAGRSGTAYAFWDVITGWWCEVLRAGPQPSTDAPVDWLHGEADAQERWTAVLHSRRVLAGVPPGSGSVLS